MEDVKVVKYNDIEAVPLTGFAGKEAGTIRRIVNPNTIGTKLLFFDIAEINPGYSPHRWHRHIYDKAGGYEIVYSENFESIYYIISGSGVAQWKTEDGQIKEIKVIAGDTIFFPPDVAEHQVLNNGAEKMIMAMCGSPPNKRKLIK